MPATFRPLAHLTALRAFEATARLGSIGLAAEELDVTPGAVSRLVRQLEDAAGLRLFERLHRGLRLTEAGERLARAVRPAFDRLREAGDALRPADGAAPLVVAAPAAFLLRWLIPRQGALQAAVAGWQVATATWDRPPDLDSPSISIFVGVGPTPADAPGGPVVRELMAERFALVLAPRLLLPGRSIAESLARVQRLVPATRPRIWLDWAAEGGPDLPHAGERRLERIFFALQAAEAGLGATIAPVELIHDSLRAGTLAAPLGAIERRGTYHLVVPARAWSGDPVRAAVRWFQREARAQATAAPGLKPRDPSAPWTP